MGQELTVEHTYNPQEILWENVGVASNNIVKDIQVYAIITVFTAIALAIIGFLEVYIRVMDAKQPNHRCPTDNEVPKEAAFRDYTSKHLKIGLMECYCDQ